MNLWIRLIKVLIGAFFKPRIGLLEASRITLRVWPTDLDFNGHVNNGRFLTLADLGRIDFLLRTGSLRVAWQHRALPIVADAMAKFRRDLRPFQRFTLETRLVGWDEKWAFLEHRFLVNERVVGVVLIKGLFRHRDGALEPAFLLQALDQPGTTPPILPGWLADWHRSSNELAGVLRAAEQA